MGYTTLKLVHISAATLSIVGFAARGLGVLSGAAWVRHRLTRMLPHVIDTVLLLSALGMLWLAGLSLWALPWLRAKSIALVIYIALGVLALRAAPDGQAGRSRAVRLVAWIGALAVFGYMVSVAFTKDPRGAVIWLQDVLAEASPPAAAPGHGAPSAAIDLHVRRTKRQ